MMEDKRIAKAGKLLFLCSGEFSDFSVIGVFVVLKDFKPLEKLSEYLDKYPNQREEEEFKKDAFLACMIADGLLLEIDYGTLYMGTHCDSDVKFNPY